MKNTTGGSTRLTRRGVVVLALAVASGALAGCPRKTVQVMAPCPTEVVSLEQLIAQHNQQAGMAPQLWSRIDRIDVTFLDDKGKPKSYTLTSGYLLLRKSPGDPLGPQDFLVTGREGNKDIFRLGSDATGGVYYFWYDVSRDQQGGRWGRYANLNRPGMQATGFNPTQLVNVLGLLPWPTRLEEPPFPTAVAELDPCVYLMRFYATRPGRQGFYLEREVTLDRRDPAHRPTLVRLYDSFGRNVMVATPRNYAAIGGASSASAGPEVATEVDIVWPLVERNGLKAIRLRLQKRDLTTAKALPESTFAFDPESLNIRDVQEIDLPVTQAQK